MRTVNEEVRRATQIEIMEKCFDRYAENGFSSVGIKAIAKACGLSAAALYLYFDNLTAMAAQAAMAVRRVKKTKIVMSLRDKPAGWCGNPPKIPKSAYLT